MTTAAATVAATVSQGIPLAPSLGVRLIALAVIEVVLLATAVLLYVRWAQLKHEPLDEWWAKRRRIGFSARTRALMEEEERQRLAAEGQAIGHAGAGAAGVAETGLAEAERGSGPPD